MIIKKLKKLRDCLNNVNADVYHYNALNKEKDYIVWSEDGESGSLNADNLKLEQTITGTIDFFTKTEYNNIIDEIQKNLDLYCISYVLSSVQYEDETKLIHYEWRFEI